LCNPVFLLFGSPCRRFFVFTTFDFPLGKWGLFFVFSTEESGCTAVESFSPSPWLFFLFSAIPLFLFFDAVVRPLAFFCFFAMGRIARVFFPFPLVGGSFLHFFFLSAFVLIVVSCPFRFFFLVHLNPQAAVSFLRTLCHLAL